MNPLQAENMFRAFCAAQKAQQEDGWSTVDTKECKALVTPNRKTGIPSIRGQSLPKLSAGGKKKVKPVPARKKPNRGWRDITAGDAANYGWKAYQMAKELWKLVNVEQKVNDVDGTNGVALSTTAAVVNLSNIAQGNDYYNRSGDSILGQRIEFRARVVGNAAKPSHTIRVLLVCDKEQNGVDPTIGDVLQGLNSPLEAPRNVFGLKRFDVLYDQRVSVCQSGDTAATTYCISQTVLPSHMAAHNRHILYDADSAADASNREGALYLMAISGDASNGPSLYYSFRLFYTDN